MNELRALRHQQLESDVTAMAATLFRRWPALAGFSVLERSSLTRHPAPGETDEDLILSDIAAEFMLGTVQAEQLFADIFEALVDLVAERPEAAELLRGRTFARTLH